MAVVAKEVIRDVRIKKRVQHIIERVKENKSYIHPKTGLVLTRPIIKVPAHERHTLKIGPNKPGQICAWGCASLKDAQNLIGTHIHAVLP